MAFIGAGMARADGPRIAITIDDLPFVNAVKSGDSRMEATRRILNALTAHRVPATGFVVCDRIGGQEEILQSWVDAGVELGNHACSHPHLDETPLERWAEEVRVCAEAVGNTADADQERWPAAVEHLRGLRADFVIPGHGDLFTTDLPDHTIRVLARARD